MVTKMKRLWIVLVLLLGIGVLAFQVMDQASAATWTTIFDGKPATLPGNLPSQAFEATSTSEFGDGVQFISGSDRLLKNVIVAMSSWGCESGTHNGGDCSTTPGATFSHDITVKIYNMGPGDAVGSLITSKTQTFDIPYRPSADPTNCASTPETWYSAADDACYNGYLHLIEFDMATSGIVLPDQAIVSIAYNTTHYGASPMGESAACYTEPGGCGYDALNVAVNSTGSYPVGTDLDLTGAYLDSTWSDAYCDKGTGGTGTFRKDAGCWSGYQPMAFEVQAAPVCTTDCYVDAASGNDANGGTSPSDAKKTVQAAVNQVSTGGTVHIADGTYVEQVVVDAKAVTLQGASLATIVQAPTSVPICFSTSVDYHPVVCARNSSTLTVDTLTVDGAGRGNGNVRFVGVAFRNSAGTVENSAIKDIRDTPFSGAQHGVGIYAYNDDLTSRTIHVLDNTLTGFQKNAMALNAGDTTPLIVDIQGNTVTGAGATTVTAQNGIQVWGDLATGTVDGNTVSGIAYDNTASSTKWVATSILNYYGDLDITNNVISGAHMGIYNIDGAGDLTGNNLTIEKVGVYAYGIEATDPPDAVPAPYSDGAAQGGTLSITSSSGELAQAATATTLVLNISNNTLAFSGTDNTATYGIEADGGYGPDDLDVTINNNTVSGFEVGIELYKCTSDCDTGVFTSLVAHQNCLSGNTWGMRSNVSELVVNGSNNWWGNASGPYHAMSNPSGTGDDVSDYIDFEPWITDSCGGTATGGNWYNTTTHVYDDLQDSLDNALAGQTIQAVGASPLSGGGSANVSGVTIDLNGKTTGPGSPAFTIVADDVTILGPGTLDGAGSSDPAIVVKPGADNFILENVEIKGWSDGVHVEGAVESLKIVGNWIHSNTDDGLQVDAAPSGVLTIEGNLFKVNGGVGVEYNGAATLKAIYNSWGDDQGPTAPLGDGVGASVAYDPWTFSEIYFDLDPATSGDEFERRVAKGNTFNVAIKADAENLYGLSFVFSYDASRLSVNSTTFSSPWTGGEGGNCQPILGLPAGQIGYYCGLTSGEEWDGGPVGTTGTIATFNLTATNPGESFFDVFVDDNLSSAAKGGIKVFVNNAGYNAPSAPGRDITDTNDGRLIIDDIANFTGFVDLQGRTNDSGASVKVYSAASGGTLLAQAASASSGKYTTVYESGQWMVVSTPPGYSVLYYLVVDRALYLPSPVPYVSAMLLTSPTTSLKTIVLLGGDGTDDNTIGVQDAGCIGSAYGSSANNCTGGTGANSDVTGDGKVDILDLTLMGGNYGLSNSPWSPLSP